MSKKKNKQLDPNIMNAPEGTSSVDLAEEVTEEETEEAVENEEATSEETVEEVKEEPNAEEPAKEETPAPVEEEVKEPTSIVEAEPKKVEEVKEEPAPAPVEEVKEVVEEKAAEPVKKEAPVVKKTEEVVTGENVYTFLLVIEGNGKDLDAIVEKIKANRRAKDLTVVKDEDMDRVIVFRTGDQKIATRKQKELVGWGIKTKMIILK